jgi:hypothetical protein
MVDRPVLTEDELLELPEEYRDPVRGLRGVQQQFLYWLLRTLRHRVAAESVGIAPSTPYEWGPQFREIFGRVQKDVLLSLEDRFEVGSAEGFEDREFKVEADGRRVLTKVRVRQDPSSLHRVLMARAPEKWGTKGEGGGEIKIVIVEKDALEGRTPDALPIPEADYEIED